MKLTPNGLKERRPWIDAGIRLPEYDVEAVREKTQEHPVWVHFGIGNIFRIFLGTAADDLIAQGLLDRGIICAETFDFEVVDKVYRPHDDLALCVTLFGDGTSDQRVIGSLCESVALRPGETAARARMKEIFSDPSLQMVSFTITEKATPCAAPTGSISDSYRKIWKTDRDRSAMPRQSLRRFCWTAGMPALLRLPWYPWTTFRTTARSSAMPCWRSQRHGRTGDM